MKGLAWPLRKDDTHKSRRVHNFSITIIVIIIIIVVMMMDDIKMQRH